MPPSDVSLVIETPHGRCVILELADAPELHDAHLLGEERQLAEGLGPTRRRELITGRAALREALGQAVPIGKDDRGAPQLPAGWVGSISHKGVRAAALVAQADAGFVGIDLEVAAPSRMPIERRILTPQERDRITDPRDVTLHFAIKEAIYKAIDPIVRRYVGFTEVDLVLDRAGGVTVTLVDPGALPVVVEAAWAERDGYWLATARARRRG